MVSDFFSKDNTVSLFFALAHTSVSTCPGIVQANHKRLFNMVGFDTTKERRWGILPKQPRWLPLKYAFTVLWQDVWRFVALICSSLEVIYRVTSLKTIWQQVKKFQCSIIIKRGRDSKESHVSETTSCADCVPGKSSVSLLCYLYVRRSNRF